MKLLHSQNRINELMARFVAEIQGSTAMGRTDLNKTAETVLIPLLNEIYGWKLENINYSEENNNYPGIDLADEETGVCIQVTATPTLDKIKHTLGQFVKHNQYEKYSRLIIFILVKKQKSYSNEAIQKIIQNKFEFDPRKAIWDYRAILGDIANFQIDRTLKVQKILEDNFGDDRQPSTSSIGKSEQQIDWREVSLKVLAAQKQQSLTSHVLGAVGSRKVPDVYVPLGLVERKNKPRVDSNLDPSKSVMPEKETTVPISHSDFFDGVLKQGDSPRSKGRRIAVIGEPGAGKTTLLQTIAARIDGIPIWVELSDLKQGQTLEDFLENHWLKRALLIIREHCPDLVPSLRTASDALKESLAEAFGTGQVCLLLNGADEMAANLGQPLAWVSEQVNHEWVSKAKVVMSCRLNLWSVSGDRLPDFDVYRNLDFNDGEVQNFITKWFAEPDEQSSGKALWGELQRTSDRIRGLVRNPLRLTLLCLSWKESGEKLPETKAGLYQRFVDAYYKWKADKPEFALSLTDQERLHDALGNLAKAALEQQDSRFRLRHGFIRHHLKPALLFEQAIKLGWLVPVGLPMLDEEHDRDEDVYTFWHPTFQEYFAAFAIDDWHYFFNHAVENPSQGIYKIFEVTWNEIIALWMGRKEISSQDKDDFLEALMDFEDNCDAHYWTKSFLLASTLLDEYSGAYSNSIFETVLEWSFGCWEESIQEWKWYSDSRARASLPLNRGNEVVEYLRSCICKSKDLHIQVNAANEIAKINPEIPELLDIVIQAFRLEDAKDEDNEIRANAVGLAEAIAGKRPEVLHLLIDQLDLLKEDLINDQQKQLLSNCIGLISPCNVRACQILIDSIENCVSEQELIRLAECLLDIDRESPLAITSLLRQFEYPEFDRSISFLHCTVESGSIFAIESLEIILESEMPKCKTLAAATEILHIGNFNLRAFSEIEKIILLTDEIDILQEACYELNDLIVKGLINYTLSSQVIDKIQKQFCSCLQSGTCRQVLSPVFLDKDFVLVLNHLLPQIESVSSRYFLVETILGFDSDNQAAISCLIELFQTFDEGYLHWDLTVLLMDLVSCKQLLKMVFEFKMQIGSNVSKEFPWKITHCEAVAQYCADKISYPAFHQIWNSMVSEYDA
jgi:hypothetical protein